MSNRAERRRAIKQAAKDAKRRPTLTPVQVVARDCVGDIWRFDKGGLRVVCARTGRETYYPGV